MNTALRYLLQADRSMELAGNPDISIAVRRMDLLICNRNRSKEKYNNRRQTVKWLVEASSTLILLLLFPYPCESKEPHPTANYIKLVKMNQKELQDMAQMGDTEEIVRRKLREVVDVHATGVFACKLSAETEYVLTIEAHQVSKAPVSANSRKEMGDEKGVAACSKLAQVIWVKEYRFVRAQYADCLISFFISNWKVWNTVMSRHVAALEPTYYYSDDDEEEDDDDESVAARLIQNKQSDSDAGRKGMAGANKLFKKFRSKKKTKPNLELPDGCQLVKLILKQGHG